MTSTKIRRLHLVDFQQFRETTLDFTDSEGKALNRICLIGRNGTGKTTTLRILGGFLSTLARGNLTVAPAAVEFEHDGARFVALAAGSINNTFRVSQDAPDVLRILRIKERREVGAALRASGLQGITPEESAALALQPNRDLLAWSQASAEMATNQGPGLASVPQTNLSNALLLGKNFPTTHFISDAHIGQMWMMLVFLVKKRDSDREQFENRPESLDKTKAQLIREFDRDNPPVLVDLASLWDRLLAPAGLEFDVQGASIPVQLTDNLLAFIRRRDNGQQVAYGALSAGLRNLLFRVGHLLLLFCRAKYERAFVLLDEPEASLFPDFLFDLTGVLEDIVGPETQMFVATHSPIIAAQFEPGERIILDFDDDGFVVASKGIAPKGDDPNDLLTKDFGLTELLGPEGRRQWEEYRRLRKAIRRAKGTPEVDSLLEKASAIARAYGFGGEPQA